MRAGLTVLALIAAGPAAAGSILDRYAPHGCAIAPDAARPEQAQRALANGQAQEQGGWLVLGPEVCTMVPPDIETALKATDEDVAPFFSAFDKYPDSPGCFLDAEALQRILKVTRGWTEERAYMEYIRSVAAGIFSGELRFYKDTPLATPVGFQLTTGTCGDVPSAKELRESHADMIESFDPFIRSNAPYIPCEYGKQFDNVGWAERYADLGQGAILNAWHSFEITFALMGSDWIEGVSLTEKGTPRPPVCVPPDMLTQ